MLRVFVVSSVKTRLMVPFRVSSEMKGDKYCTFVGLAYQGKDIVVFRFIIEYSSLRDFGP